MNTKQLQYFLATAEQGSITAAARELDVAQPAISLQIANLEHELKIKLFERDFRGVELTDAGRKFAHHARIILAQINAAKTELLGNRSEYKGKVVVGLTQASCNVLSVELLTELEHRFANIELVLQIGSPNAIARWLEKETIDIAIGYQGDQPNMAPNTIALIRENLYLYISRQPKNPAYSELVLYGSLPFKELAHYDLFMAEEQDNVTRMVNAQAKLSGIKLKPKNAFGQLMTTLHYVTQGYGLVILPSSGAFHLESSNQIRAINLIQPELQSEVFLQVAERKCQDAAVNAVFELIREVTANMHANDHWRGTLLDKKYHAAKRLSGAALALG